MSPRAGSSIFITSAPRSARCMVPKGRAPYCSTAIIRPPLAVAWACKPSSPLSSFVQSVPLEQTPRDHQALYFVGSLAYGHQRGIAEVTLHVIILVVTVTTMNAHGLEAVVDAGLAGEELRHTCLEVATLAAIELLGGIPEEQTGSLDADRHIGQLQLYGLMLGDGLSEGLALLGVGDRVLEGGASDAQSAGSDVDAPQLQALHDVPETLSFLTAEQIIRRNPEVLEHELSAVDAPVA